MMECPVCGQQMIFIPHLGGRLDEECLDRWVCEKCGNEEWEE
jgi:ribosomal protein S27AE